MFSLTISCESASIYLHVNVFIFSKLYLIFKDLEVFDNLLYCHFKWSFLCQIKASSAYCFVDDDAF